MKYSLRTAYKAKLVRDPGVTIPKQETTIRFPEDAVSLCRLLLREEDTGIMERFVVVGLNSANKPIAYLAMDGDTDHATIYIQKVFRFLLLSGSTRFICAHNHPSGSTLPSNQDLNLKKDLETVGDALNIKMMDFIILGGDDTWCSSENP